MNKKKYKLISFFTVCILLINTFTPFVVYASEGSNGDSYDSDAWTLYDGKDLTNVITDQILNRGIHEGTADFYENFIRYATEYISYCCGQVGAVVVGDMYAIDDNTERLYQDLKNITDNGKITVDNNNKKIKISKGLTDNALAFLNKKTQDTSGYTLMKTIAKSSLHGSSFPSTNAYNTMLKAFQYSECNMVLMRQDKFSKDANANNYFTQLYFAPLNYTIANSETKGNNIDNCMLVKHNDVYMFYDAKGAKPFQFYYMRHYASEEPPTSEYFQSNSAYSSVLLAHQYDATAPLYNNISTAFYLVSSTGVSVPVFDNLDAMLDYSVKHNLYYTSSSYTGEGKEITIDYNEIDKILNGYYNGMYDMLQQLIEQTGSGITPEQLQELVDSVQASFGMLKDTINQGFEQQDILIQKNSSILQNIADALNAFFSQQKTFNETVHQILTDIKTALTKNSGTTSSGADSGILTELKTIIKDGFDDVVKELKKIRRWTALDTVFDGLDAVADWLDFVTKFFNDVGTGVSALAEGFTSTVTELTKVFPFSIPVTLTLIMDLLSAPPQVPKFELPIKIEHLGIDEKITIDLTEFGTISVISRTFLTIIYCVGLYQLSFKIVSAKKGA